MDDQELKNLWQSYDKKLEQSLVLNYQLFKELRIQKAEGKITSFKRSQIFGVIAGTIWIAMLIVGLFKAQGNIYFMISIGMIVLFNVYATAAYLWHLIVLGQINIEERVVETQKKLAEVQTSLNRVGRILFLQSPFYCTFWYSPELINQGDTSFFVINGLVVAFFTAGSIYLYRTLTYRNIHKKWVRKMMENFGGKTLINAMEFINEIEEFKKENPVPEIK